LAALDRPSPHHLRGPLGAAGAFAADADVKGVAARPPNARADLADEWFDPNGRYRFPDNDGFKGPPQEVTLAPGTLIDRYGQPGGRFLSPAGTPYEARALPYDRAKMDYYRYEVVKPLAVKAGEIVPWFDQPGGGTQYVTAISVGQLVTDGYLRETGPPYR
jgi:hypothetical protein